MKLTIVNLVLVLLIAATVWQFFCKWLRYQDREIALYLPPVAVAAPPFEGLPRVLAPPIQEYAIITQLVLFFPDRAPFVSAEPKIMPPFSGRLWGVIDFGSDPIALLSEQSGGKALALRPGDRVGSFKLVSVNRNGIVLEWEGEYLRLPVRQWMGQDTSESPPGTSLQGLVR